jgi:hypothetical protein
MIFEFDKDFAKEAIELGEGRIITRDGEVVTIADWDYFSDFYPISGTIAGYSSYPELWSEFGEYRIGCKSPYDLLVELFENESNSL